MQEQELKFRQEIPLLYHTLSNQGLADDVYTSILQIDS